MEPVIPDILSVCTTSAEDHTRCYVVCNPLQKLSILKYAFYFTFLEKKNHLFARICYIMSIILIDWLKTVIKKYFLFQCPCTVAQPYTPCKSERARLLATFRNMSQQTGVEEALSEDE